jgi:serine/threonine protein kinase
VAGRYRVERCLGEGGMGVVYAAQQLPLERPVALKVLVAQLAREPENRARFEREARVASALRHPNAVEVYDFGEDDGRAYLAMEFLHGRTLREELSDKGPLPVPRVLDLGYQLADVLVAAHLIGMVHRDLKPENIFLEGERLVVVDFGLAFIAERPRAGRMTRDDLISGTPEYLSPEQARGLALGSASDVYALGCVLYELVTGAPPFVGDAATVIAKHIYAEPASPRAKAAQPLPDGLEAVILRALGKRPETRGGAEEIRAALAEISPDETLGRQRGRALPEIRVARAVSVERKAAEAPTDVEVPVFLDGVLPPELTLAMAASGYRLVGEAREAKLALALGASTEKVHALAERGLVVLADADPGDLNRLLEMIRAGASDCVLRPLRAEGLVGKLGRLHRTRGRA